MKKFSRDLMTIFYSVYRRTTGDFNLFYYYFDTSINFCVPNVTINNTLMPWNTYVRLWSLFAMIFFVTYFRSCSKICAMILDFSRFFVIRNEENLIGAPIVRRPKFIHAPVFWKLWLIEFLWEGHFSLQNCK